MTVRVLALGDSIMWGQGLKEKDKFTALVAAEIARKRATDVDVVRYAHSGATVWSKAWRYSSSPDPADIGTFSVVSLCSVGPPVPG